jgi:hypothetical protein
MGNIWNYRALMESRQRPSPAVVRQILHTLASHGFDPENRSSTISGFSLDDLEDVTFTTRDQAISWLVEHPGSIQLWHRSIPNLEIDLTISPLQRAPHADLSGQDPFLELTIGLDATHFRPQRSPEAAATTIRSAFISLISKVRSPYAYVLDEEIAETLPNVFVRLAALHTAVAAAKPPPEPFWLNYFRQDYAMAVGLDRLRQIDASVRAEAHGYVLQLTEHPWELTNARLHEVRQRWWAIFDSARS